MRWRPYVGHSHHHTWPHSFNQRYWRLNLGIFCMQNRCFTHWVTAAHQAYRNLTWLLHCEHYTYYTALGFAASSLVQRTMWVATPIGKHIFSFWVRTNICGVTENKPPRNWWIRVFILCLENANPFLNGSKMGRIERGLNKINGLTLNSLTEGQAISYQGLW